MASHSILKGTKMSPLITPKLVTRLVVIYCFADLRNKWHLVIDRLTVLFLKFLEYFHKLQVFMWWILELHIIKIVSSYIIWVTVKEASVLFYQTEQNMAGPHFLCLWVHSLYNAPYIQGSRHM